jgi:integrase
MAFPMVKLRRSNSGAFTARKGIPKDVRDEHQRLYGQGWEVQFHAEAGTPLSEAKARFNDWLAEHEVRIKAIRAGQKGQGQPLTQRQAHRLAGDWYLWFVGRHEEEPGDPMGWWSRRTEFEMDLEEWAPASFRENPESDPRWSWLEDPKVRPAARAIIADYAKTAPFLAGKGVALTNEARDLFLDCVLEEFLAATRLLERRAEGDFSADPRPKRFPQLSPKSTAACSGRTCWDLFDAWVNVKKPAISTVTRWRTVFLNLQSAFPERAADAISEQEAKDWADQLIGPGRSARTVSDIWVMGARTVYRWAVRERLATINPFATVTVTVPRKAEVRGKAFTHDEARAILNAAKNVTYLQTPSSAARRWVPWLCAYSGARCGELTQLRGTDIERHGPLVAMRITPDAGTTKTNKPRTVPIHEHVLEQGFLDYVKLIGKGPLFYVFDPSREHASDPTNPRRPRAVKTRDHLASWVRKIGITDRAISPNHAWRYTFKQIAARNDITEVVIDEICGHAQLTVGRGYLRPTLEDMAEALRRFPRYVVD